MTSETTTHHPAQTAKQHATFFKQSGWLMIASIGGGMLTWGVHFLSKSIPPAEYSVFGTLLMVTAVLPTMPLQMIFAAQTASALATNRERQLAGMVRLAFGCVFVIWLAAAVLVLALGLGAAGMVSGALAGMSVVMLLSVWRTRDLWRQPSEKIDGRALFKQVAPLMLGFGAFQFMFTSDTMFAQAYFTSEEMAPYVAAGTLSRALLWLVLPLAAVMFPKLVHSNAKSEKSNLLKIVLLGTAALAICGGLGLWLVGPIVVKLVYKTGYVAATTALLPWYAAAMVPLALANVLVNDLMARARFRAVPGIVAVAVGYGFALPYILNHYALKLETVLQTLGVFNCLLLAVCAWGAFGGSKPSVQKSKV